MTVLDFYSVIIQDRTKKRQGGSRSIDGKLASMQEDIFDPAAYFCYE
ncbi:MAG: hypothetical protein HYU35_00950 [Parcubacteria group bacterium]|nr:hypothetical protein [Parcubacteria group bacterium]